jgi:hypothetical protein
LTAEHAIDPAAGGEHQIHACGHPVTGREKLLTEKMRPEAARSLADGGNRSIPKVSAGSELWADTGG